MKRPNGYALIILIFSTILTCSCNGKIDMNEKLSNNRHTENERITFKEGKKIKELLFNFNKLKLPNEDRRFVQIELNSKFKLGGVNNELLLTPSFVKVDKNKNIYVLDNIDSSVKKFDNMGHYVEKYGKKGAGPGEFERAWNFDVSVDGVTVISSPNNNKFAVFDRDEIIEFKPIDMAINLCFTTTGEVLIFQIADLINKSPFRRIDYKKDIIIEYQNILKTKKNEGMLPFLMGDVHRYRDNNIVYISQIMGYIVIYDDDGKIVSVFRLIDKVVHSGLTKREEKIAGFSSPLVRFPREDEYLFFVSNIFEDNLYILKNNEKTDSNEYIIDIYSLSEAGYKYSLLLKTLGEIKSVYFTSTNLYVVKANTEVEVFEYNILEKAI